MLFFYFFKFSKTYFQAFKKWNQTKSRNLPQWCICCLIASFKKGGKIQTGLNCEYDGLSKVILTLSHSRNWSNNLYLHQQVGTVMMLFTRQNLEKAQLIEYNNASSILESNYNASLDTKLIIHGFGSSCHRVWAREMRLSFLAVVSSSKKDFVFCVRNTSFVRESKFSSENRSL